MSKEQAQIRAAIAALENQRSLLSQTIRTIRTDQEGLCLVVIIGFVNAGAWAPLIAFSDQ